MRTVIALVIARVLRFCIRLVRPGGGSSVPGRLAAIVAPNMVIDAFRQMPLGVVFVTGSAGKSTTTNQLVAVLRAHKLRVFTNPSTSNIRQGFFTAVMTACDWRGRVSADIAVFEVDEAHGAVLAKQFAPRLTLFTNLMSDQLDRFVDPEFVYKRLLETANGSAQIIVNSDDTNLRRLSLESQVPIMQISSNALVQSQRGYPQYALSPVSVGPLEADSITLQSVTADKCVLEHNGLQHDFTLAASGPHMALNLALAIAGAMTILGEKFAWPTAQDAISNSSGVFARWERVGLRGFPTTLVLVQNPGSFQINLDLVDAWPKRIFIGVGRDVHDPSWLWTVDFARLPRVDMVAGFNAPEFAARLVVADIVFDAFEADVPKAVDDFLDLPLGSGEERIMFITADAMRRMRRHLRLAK